MGWKSLNATSGIAGHLQLASLYICHREFPAPPEIFSIWSCIMFYTSYTDTHTHTHIYIYCTGTFSSIYTDHKSPIDLIITRVPLFSTARTYNMFNVYSIAPKYNNHCACTHSHKYYINIIIYDNTSFFFSLTAYATRRGECVW